METRALCDQYWLPGSVEACALYPQLYEAYYGEPLTVYVPSPPQPEQSFLQKALAYLCSIGYTEFCG
jgi:hypothetical protein